MADNDNIGKEREVDISAISLSQNASSSVEGVDIKEEIKSYTESIGELIKTFQNECTSLFFKVLACVLISAILIGFLCGEFQNFFDYKFDEKWTWQIAYETTIRVAFITLFASIIAFSLKMLRSFIHLYEHHKHKIAVIRAMPTLIKISNTEQADIAYIKILDMIIQPEKMGLIKDDEKEVQVGVLELLQKIKAEK